MFGRNALAGNQQMMPPSPSGPTQPAAPPPPKWGPGFPNNQPPPGMAPGGPQAPGSPQGGDDPISVLEHAIALLKAGQMPPQDFAQIVMAIAQMFAGAMGGGPEQMQPPPPSGFAG